MARPEKVSNEFCTIADSINAPCFIPVPQTIEAIHVMVTSLTSGERKVVVAGLDYRSI